MPQLLPWLATLGLLALGPNRQGCAWWIWLPLAFLFAVELVMPVILGALPSEVLNTFCDVVHALTFGIAAVWLLAPFLGDSSRYQVFLKVLLAQSGVAVGAFLAGRNWGAPGDELPTLIMLGVFTLALALALILAGFTCRRIGLVPLRLSAWLLAWLVICCAAVVLPFAIFVIFAGGAGVVVGFGLSVLVGASAGFIMMLPFLALAFAVPFYRERLGQLLRLEPTAEPPVVPPVAVSTPAN